MTQQKTVLLAPLNWGLGHAARLVPVIELFMQSGARVLLAADKRPYDFLKQRFPECEIIRLPGFEPFYPEQRPLAVEMMRAFPNMLKTTGEAHKTLQQMIDHYHVDIVVSDNRFELSSSKAYCIFISHQLHIKTYGWQHILQPLLKKINHGYIKKFDELWIPDYEDAQHNLAGRLSHVKRYPVKNYHYIGMLSRLSNYSGIQNKRSPGLLIILSGPEPQRTVFEKLITGQLLKSGLKATVLQSTPEQTKVTAKGNITFIPHASDREIAEWIRSADLIISRPGYSTIMDLAVFGKNAVFVPTPGQTEQNYLAARLHKHGYCYFEEQKSFKLERAVRMAESYSGLPRIYEDQTLRGLISRLLA